MNMKKFKIVEVYSGYGEMGIEGIDVVEGKSLKGVCSKLNKDNLKGLLEYCESKEEEKINKSLWEEFYNFVKVNSKEGWGSVGGGEEDFYLVFGEKSKWFELIDNNKEWSEEFFEKEWKEFCYRG